MKASELRIGNIVQLLSEGTSTIPSLPTGIKRIVTSIRLFDLELCDIDKPIIQQEPIKFDINRICAVELSKEILENYGFKLMPISEYTLDTYELNGLKLWNDKNDFTNLRFLTDDFDIRVKYLHQLQNLYYSVTKKELKAE